MGSSGVLQFSPQSHMVYIDCPLTIEPSSLQELINITCEGGPRPYQCNNQSTCETGPQQCIGQMTSRSLPLSVGLPLEKRPNEEVEEVKSVFLIVENTGQICLYGAPQTIIRAIIIFTSRAIKISS